jgi:hypothetical protein
MKIPCNIGMKRAEVFFAFKCNMFNMTIQLTNHYLIRCLPGSRFAVDKKETSLYFLNIVRVPNITQKMSDISIKPF